MEGKKNAEIIKEIAQELLEKLQIKSTVSISLKKDLYELTIETDESGLLIGYHGTTLASLQLILGTLVFKKLAKWERIVVNVGDYRERREETLKNLAQTYAQQAITTGEPVILPYLPASERRIIHLVLQDHPRVITESQGEGKERRITIRLKNNK